MGAAGAHGGLVRIVTAGSVDDGKSTLIGRLLYDTKQILADQMAHIAEVSARRGLDTVDLALLTDGLRAEREQGITIDVAYRYFATPRRKFILADCPGHVQYTRNMVTGASTADVAIVLLDAREGPTEQSRRHTFLASLLGISHLVLAVNKMDLVDYDEAVYERVVDEMTDFTAKLEIPDVTFIPVSALHGDNIVDRSESMPWYGGPPVLWHLEHLHVASDRNLIDVRFPVQWVVRPQTEEAHDYRGYAGQVASGILKPGDEVLVQPSGRSTRIERIETIDGEVGEAFPPMSVTVHLDDDLDISRGDLICRPHNQPLVTRELDAMVCWMSDEPLRPGARLVVKHTTRTARGIVEDLRYRLDVNTLHRDLDASELLLNDIGRITLRLSAPLIVDPYRRNRSTGSFILVDESSNDTVAGGMILHPAADRPISEGVVWERSGITRRERWAATGLRGATIWMTGLPASGKSTLAAAVEQRLIEMRRPAYRLDGDNLRHGLNGDLGFDRASRDENVRRAGEVARLMSDAGMITIVSLISPYAEGRGLVRAAHEDADLSFLEVWVSTPLEECERRDPKGLYAKARRGELTGMTGIDDPYEAPASPDLEVRPSDAGFADDVERILELLRERRVIE